ncbi:MAG: hypothetical protein J7L71_11615 [Spirochaetaceae bacterium]|nr:hypothetical protein [Spirochaetaceae bacterium]
MNLKGNELVSIFLFLVQNEDKLDQNQQSVKKKIENELFNCLSIAEMESLGELYAKKVDVLKKKL